MITNPFSIFAPFPDLQVTLFTKEDNINSDEQIAKKLNTKHIAGLNQVHGNRVLYVTKPLARTEEADGMFTDQKDLVLTVRTADCQPFIVFAPERNVHGVIHAGWRGLIAGIIPRFFDMLTSTFGINPQEVLVAAGPSLCTSCAQFDDTSGEISLIGSECINGHQVDLQRKAELQLFSAGVHPKHFERHADCTCCQPEQYWTYRGGDREDVLSGCTNVMTICRN
ncbi:MAG: polyphenol oxidase family protein [Kiritimatiellales bacterium]|nr:polyphenol oxidase family protein [Kiritimatiellales bacterium]